MAIHENGSILIPIDFSKQSLIAIEQSYNLAKYTKSKIILMYASPSGGTEHATEIKALAEKTQQQSGQQTEYILLKGNIFDLIDDKAEELKSSLIVIGLDTQTRFRSFIGVTNVGKFLKNAPCPVITIRGVDNRNSCKNILMPIDLSAESREKVGTAVQVAKYYGATVRIISIFSPSDEKFENEILPYINQIKKFIKDRGVECTNKLIPSKNAVEAIISYANNNECDMIIQMNKPSLSLGELFVGAAAQNIAESSNIPVLSIKPMKRESLSTGIH